MHYAVHNYVFFQSSIWSRTSAKLQMWKHGQHKRALRTITSKYASSANNQMLRMTQSPHGYGVITAITHGHAKTDTKTRHRLHYEQTRLFYKNKIACNSNRYFICKTTLNSNTIGLITAQQSKYQIYTIYTNQSNPQKEQLFTKSNTNMNITATYNWFRFHKLALRDSDHKILKSMHQAVRPDPIHVGVFSTPHHCVTVMRTNDTSHYLFIPV